MGKKFSKKIGRFDSKNYASNRQAVLALTEAGMSIDKISEALKLSATTVHAMRKYDWAEYQVYRQDKYERQQELRKAKEAPQERVPFYTPAAAPDQTAVIAERLLAIEDKIDRLISLVSKRKFF
jgi:DNA-binding transcriptional MerR regulator